MVGLAGCRLHLSHIERCDYYYKKYVLVQGWENYGNNETSMHHLLFQLNNLYDKILTKFPTITV